MAAPQHRAAVCILRDMDSRLPTLTKLEQWAAMARETYEALHAAGFTEQQAERMTLQTMKRG